MTTKNIEFDDKKASANISLILAEQKKQDDLKKLKLKGNNFVCANSSLGSKVFDNFPYSLHLQYLLCRFKIKCFILSRKLRNFYIELKRGLKR